MITFAIVMLNISIKRNILTIRGVSILFLCVFILGFFVGEFYPPTSTIGLVGFVILSIISSIKIKWSFNQLKNPYIISFFVLFLLYLSGLLTTQDGNWGYYFKRLTLKLPFLLFPLAFTMQSSLTKANYQLILKFFLFMMFVTEAGSLINYMIDFEQVNQLYLQSKIMPVISNHVRYSLMACSAVYIAYYLYRESDEKVYLYLSIFFFFFIHVLAVRSGLLAVYLLVGAYGVYTIIKKRYLESRLLVLTSVLMLLLSFFVLPSFQNKLLNTQQDLSHINNDDIEEEKKASDFSLVGRKYSYKVGLELFSNSPILGVGIGNIDAEVTKMYKEEHPMIIKILMPHNQFIRLLAESGVVGLLVFLYGFYFFLFRNKNYLKSPVLLMHYGLITISFLFEGTMETQLGFNFTLFFIVLTLSQLGHLSFKKYCSEDVGLS